MTANRIRIIKGDHFGRIGAPHERTASGRYSVKFENGQVIWFDKDQIRTLMWGSKQSATATVDQLKGMFDGLLGGIG